VFCCRGLQRLWYCRPKSYNIQQCIKQCALMFILSLVEIKWINVHRNTTVFSNFLRKQLHVLVLFWVGHHQVETRISVKTHTLQCGHQAWEMRSRFTMFGEECSYIYAIWTLWCLRLDLSCLL
jgi:hypothetical protein